MINTVLALRVASLKNRQNMKRLSRFLHSCDYVLFASQAEKQTWSCDCQWIVCLVPCNCKAVQEAQFKLVLCVVCLIGHRIEALCMSDSLRGCLMPANSVWLDLVEVCTKKRNG